MRFCFVGHSEQGVKVSARILARAGLVSGLIVQAYAPALRGVGDGHAASVRMTKDKGEILEIGPMAVSEADFTIAFDPSLLNFKELKEKSILIVNTAEKLVSPAAKKRGIKIIGVDATGIGKAKLGLPWPASAMLGAISKVFPKIPLKTMKAAMAEELFERLVENQIAAEEGFKTAK